MFPNWSPTTPACAQQAFPTPECVNLNIDTGAFFRFFSFFSFFP